MAVAFFPLAVPLWDSNEDRAISKEDAVMERCLTGPEAGRRVVVSHCNALKKVNEKVDRNSSLISLQLSTWSLSFSLGFHIRIFF